MRRDVALGVATVVVVATAALPLHRVFTTAEWRPPVVAAALLATLLAALLRRLRVPGWLALVVSLAGMLALTARLYATEAGPWPTPAALGELWRLTLEGFEDIRLQPAPTPPLDGLRLLLTAGVWVVTHVTHEALVRLRRPGVGLTAAALLWFTPLAVPRTGLPAWPNALPFFVACGLVLLLDPDPDEGGGWTREDTTPRLRAGGVALTGIAAVTGLLAPWVLPGYGHEAWVDVTAATEPRGYQPIVDVGDRLTLPTPRDVLEVSSSRATYLRLAALDTFDGRTWRLGPPDVETFRPDPDELFRAEGVLPFETDILDGTVVEASVEVLDLENIYVPVPYQVQEVTGPDGANLFYSRQGGFVATGDVEDNELRGQTRVGVREGFTYTVDAFVPTPTYDDLAALGQVDVAAGDPRLALPPGYEDFAELTEQVTAAAGATTTIDRVLAVQDYFTRTGGFTYSTNVPELRGDDALRQFLFDTRTGYCEYFATSMAVMLRADGVAARVAVGFLPGRVTDRPDAPGEDATFVVSTSDAHAWVEVWFADYGWVRMDPTPRSETLAPSAEDFDPQPAAALPAPEQTEAASDDPNEVRTGQPSAPDLPPQFEEGGGVQAGEGDFDPGTSVLAVVLAVLLVTGVLATVLVYGEPVLRRIFARRHRDPATDVLAAMRRVLATADHLGVGRRRDQTVTEVALRWARDGLVDPDDAAMFARLASTAAFAGPDVTTGLDGDDARAMRTLERRLVAGLHGAVDRRQRLTAPWRRAATQVAERVPRRTGRYG